MNKNKKEVVEIIFSYLYTQYFQIIYKYIYRMIGNKDEAEQFTQQTFTKLYSFLISNLSIKNPKAFIYRIANNTCFDYLRKKRKIKEVENKGFLIREYPHNPDKEIEKRQREELIRDALLKLPAREQKCIHLYLEGFSYSEIADIIKIKKTSVGKILSRATEKLASVIKKGENL